MLEYIIKIFFDVYNKCEISSKIIIFQSILDEIYEDSHNNN